MYTYGNATRIIRLDTNHINLLMYNENQTHIYTHTHKHTNALEWVNWLNYKTHSLMIKTFVYNTRDGGLNPLESVQSVPARRRACVCLCVSLCVCVYVCVRACERT